MMDSEWFQRDADHVLVDGQSTHELLAPLKRSSRLKYNCISVSNKLVAVGCNTGGIYIFSRTDQKLLQIAFAEKETNSVSLVKISPHEKYVAFVSSNNVYVLDLKLESRSKAETLRSTSDLSGCMVTCLLWDQTSAKLYVGDDLGKVSMMPVYSNKAKNLFSLPLEVIMKLDSAVVQLDKAEEKVLVSTLTRCYVCDTSKQQYTQIGKKLRDGHFGACFLTQGTSAPMIYSARPGSRIWEVDFEGNVLNTHQFKQLLAIPPSPVVTLDQKYSAIADDSVYKGQSVAFPRLVTLRNNFLLTWTTSTVYIIDPINVKVILWNNQFSGIQDICSVDKEVYIFLETMALECLTLHAVTSVIPMFIKAKDSESAANMCIRHRDVFLHKHVRKKFGVTDLYKIHDKLVSENMADLAEQIHEVMVNIENKLANELENEMTGSGRSRSGSTGSGASTGSLLSGGTNNAITVTGEVEKGIREEDLKNAQPTSDINQNLNESCKDETEMEKTSTENTKCNLNFNTEKHENQGKELILKQLENNHEAVNNMKEDVDVENMPEAMKSDEEIPVPICDDMLEGEQEVHKQLTSDYEKVLEDNRDKVASEQDNDEGGNESKVIENLTSKVESGQDFSNFNSENSDATSQQISDVRVSVSPVDMATVDADVDMNMENDDDIGYLRAVAVGPRRLSLTSLSSVDSGDVNLDQPFPNELSESSDKIAIPMKRKSGKKKRRRASAIENTDVKSEVPVRISRSLSAGTMQAFPSFKERALSPHGSVHSVKEEDSISIYSNDSLIEEGNSESPNTTDNKETTDSSHANKSAESMSIGSALSNSGEFGQSGEFHRSGDYLQSGEFSPGESTLARSWEKNKQGQTTTSSSAPKAAFLQLKNKMQTKVTSGTKNLIRNIKEKNLLSKAKEFAENLSQGSEVYLHSEGQFNETPDILMTHPDFAQHLKDTENQIEDTDVVDGIDKAIADLTQLEIITAETKEKLQDIDILMDPEAVYKVLSNWVTVLNKTFQEFHIKKYGVLDGNKLRENEVADTVKEGENVSPVNDCDGVVGTEHCKVDEAKDSRNLGDSSQYEKSTDSLKVLKANGGIPDRVTNIRNPASVIDILSNKNYCYLVDPLHLTTDLFQNVCELAQACFDIGCHGNILKFIEYRYCEQKSKEKEDNLKNTEEVVTNVSDINTVENEDKKDNVSELDKDTSSLEDNSPDKPDVTSFPVGNIVNGNSEKTDETESQKRHSISKTEVCDREITSDPANHSDQRQVESSHDKCVVENEVVDTEKVVKGAGMIGLESDGHDHQDKQLELIDKVENTESVQRDTNQPTFKQNSDYNVNKVVEESCVMPKMPKLDSEIQDKAMGFFVRCYFPYLTVLRVREETLTRKCSYHLWSALLICMEGKARYDSEKYGIADASIINYLMENQAANDQGAMLLGHISSLFLSNKGSVVDICVRCHPFVHPVDVLYMCRYHQVAMETVFKQYMIWMTMDETSAIKEHILSDVGKSLEACLVWLELLLSEDKEGLKVMNEQGCPRCMGHKVSWKNEALVHQLTTHIQAHDGERMALEMFRKYGYWGGVLKFLKKSGPRSEHLKLVLQLGDVDLLNGQSELGYETQSISDWQEVLGRYQKIISEAGNQASQEVCSDWSTLITWNSLAVLLVRHIGSEEALSLLEKHNIPEGVLSPEFYQVCLLSGMVQRQQRLVLHSMLEKVDSYLWSQRPPALTPQLLYLANLEKKGPPAESASTHPDLLQTMGGSLKEKRFQQFVEDPECHWGIETKINLSCPCCYIALKDTVSLEEPGVLIFRCGHGYHKFCLPYKECMLCEDVLGGDSSEKMSFI